jgi:hypothetical protein
LYFNKVTRIALFFIWQVIYGRLNDLSSIARNRIEAGSILQIETKLFGAILKMAQGLKYQDQSA